MPFPDPTCRDDARRAELLKPGGSSLNGIDYLEVQPNYVVLRVVFLKTPAPAVTKAQVRVEGGVRIRGIQVLGAVPTAAGSNAVDVTVNTWGDHSTYTLVIDHPGLDPYYARVDFRFTVDCPGRFDCRPRAECVPDDEPEPLIDYLAKDYASFRQAMLDLLAARLPDWRERHEADLGVALVELLAYAGDQLSYFQDAVANEAYLETARQRISVRRHARLIDYRMHDGASARVLVWCEAGVAGFVPKGTRFVTRLAGPLGTIAVPGPVIPQLYAPAAEAAGGVFEAVARTAIDPRLNRLQFHTWGNARCSLCAGATQADLQDPTLTGTLADVLTKGTLLVFEEYRSPATGATEDADPTRRQVVRVIGVEKLTDPVLNQKVVRITWGAGDALRTGFCLSAVDKQGVTHLDVSVARGNLVLADQGRAYADWHPRNPAAAGATPVKVGYRPYRFSLKNAPLAFRNPVPKVPTDPPPPAADLFVTDPQRADPWVRVETQAGPAATPEPWDAFPDLLASGPLDTHVAVETDNAGRAVLRFGDNVNGRSPDGLFVRVFYRTTRGSAGNVAAEALAHAIDDGTLTALVTGVRNPLPAWGGADPEPMERVKRIAPDAFRSGLHRAVTEADYARAAELHPAVDRAVARFRWTGSWRTVYLLIDPKGRAGLPPDLRADVHRHVGRFALAGYDLEVRPAIYAPLEVDIEVCAARGHFRADVERVVLEALASDTLPGGRTGFFHPDRFTFGDPVYLSQLYAAVVAVPGVSSARVTRFRRTDQEDPDPARPATAANIDAGRIAVGRFEVARLDNDPDFPENGTLRLTVMGGA